MHCQIFGNKKCTRNFHFIALNKLTLVERTVWIRCNKNKQILFPYFIFCSLHIMNFTMRFEFTHPMGDLIYNSLMIIYEWFWYISRYWSLSCHRLVAKAQTSLWNAKTHRSLYSCRYTSGGTSVGNHNRSSVGIGCCCWCDFLIIIGS